MWACQKHYMVAILLELTEQTNLKLIYFRFYVTLEEFRQVNQKIVLEGYDYLIYNMNL